MTQIRLIAITILLGILTSCKTNSFIAGGYGSIFPEIGFFGTKITLKPDSAFHYVFSGDLTHIELDGTYKIKSKTLYLRFSKLKEDYKPLVFGTSENPDTVLNFEDWQNSHSYDLKKESGIEYHLKYQIKGNKLKPYHIETNRIVRRAKYYSDKKRYIVFGPNYRKKKWYLKKIE